MPSCHECGASLPEGGSCQDLFHQLLAIEHAYLALLPPDAGEQGEVAHFYAVSTYILQHPEQMRFTAEALAGVRENLEAHLDGRFSLEAVRRHVRRHADGAARVTRRKGDPVVHWPVDAWQLTVQDVLAPGPAGYGDRVAEWAEATLASLRKVS